MDIFREKDVRQGESVARVLDDFQLLSFGEARLYIQDLDPGRSFYI